jgi:hypothetical protein
MAPMSRAPRVLLLVLALLTLAGCATSGSRAESRRGCLVDGRPGADQPLVLLLCVQTP